MIRLFFFTIIFAMAIFFAGCNVSTTQPASNENLSTSVVNENAEYFNLRPALGHEYGYTHAVKIGNGLKISGAVSMDNSGKIVAPGNMEQQMKNCYSDLEKILKHYGYTFDDVFAENIYTTDMAAMEKALGFKNTIYTKQFPTGTWLEVKGLAVRGQLIEIDIEAHKANWFKRVLANADYKTNFTLFTGNNLFIISGSMIG